MSCGREVFSLGMCQRDYFRVWRARPGNLERKATQNREWYARHKDEILPRLRANWRRYYYRHRERVLDRTALSQQLDMSMSELGDLPPEMFSLALTKRRLDQEEWKKWRKPKQRKTA